MAVTNNLKIFAGGDDLVTWSTSGTEHTGFHAGDIVVANEVNTALRNSTIFQYALIEGLIANTSGYTDTWTIAPDTTYDTTFRDNVMSLVDAHIAQVATTTTVNNAVHSTQADAFTSAKSVTLTGDVSGTISSTGGWSIPTTLTRDKLKINYANTPGIDSNDIKEFTLGTIYTLSSLLNLPMSAGILNKSVVSANSVSLIDFKKFEYATCLANEITATSDANSFYVTLTINHQGNMKSTNYYYDISFATDTDMTVSGQGTNTCDVFIDLLSSTSQQVKTLGDKTIYYKPEARVNAHIILKPISSTKMLCSGEGILNDTFVEIFNFPSTNFFNESNSIRIKIDKNDDVTAVGKTRAIFKCTTNDKDCTFSIS